MLEIANCNIKYLTGVGERYAKMLNDELGIYTFRDLLYYFPYKYIDRSRIYRACELNAEMPYVQLDGVFLSFETEGEGHKMRLVGHFSDGTGIVDCVWFQGIKYVLKSLKPQTRYIVFGKPNFFNGRFSVVHPDVDRTESLTLSALGLQPFYNTSEKMKRHGLTSRTISKMMDSLLRTVKGQLEETLPPSVCQAHFLIPLEQAMMGIHCPTTTEQLRNAQRRLKFEELFFTQFNILRYATDRKMAYRGQVFQHVGALFNTFYSNNLPFPLTEAQKRVIREIRTDMRSGKQMNRLLQGDVGSGKTLVALMCMLLALDNGFQACMVAPTEILAEQHLSTIQQFLCGMDVRIELLTGMVKGKKRKAVLEGLQDGTVQILVGTHAVMEDNVMFRNLGFVVVDEQHRFGVAQRAKLWAKNTTPPHVLVMTATPIPRTLAMTLYGDLDVSVIDELPPGRKPITTLHCYEERREGLNGSIRNELKKGRQVYVVFPLIKENEKMDLKNLEEGYTHICSTFPEFKVSKVHGKMKAADKDEEMRKFVAGETQILVATTVIEVGVNVPNASVMVIENADRFGLSQLHQLRGRVGRGAEQSYCVLVTKYQLAEATRRRMQIMTSTTDGFEIAEEDLKLRGPGDLEGTQQSGVAIDLKLANLAKDGQLVQEARNAAQRILDADPKCETPESKQICRQLQLMKKETVNWSSIS